MADAFYKGSRGPEGLAMIDNDSAAIYVCGREVTAYELEEMRAAWKEYRERDTLTPRRKAKRRRYVPYHRRPLIRRGRHKKITE